MRRRRTKYTWFPVIGGDVADPGESEIALSTVTRSLGVTATGNVSTDVIPIIPDEPSEVPAAGDHLVDYIGTSWFIKRLVGKLHLTYTQQAGEPSSGAFFTTIPAAAVITAGFFVARVDATEVSVPIGDNNNLTQDYSPLALATQREPWIWRRSWILGNNAAADIASITGQKPEGFAFPATNASRSVADGPHIDSKTARRSQNDERLWFAISATAFAFNETNPAEFDGQVTYTLDLRVLGAIRKQRNRSAF